jgi:tRNA (guanine37-N1)-methyltransferase
LAEESFAEGLLEYPHYTRPQVWQGRTVPEVLVSGDHQRVRAWRRERSERLTQERRPDLWEDFCTAHPESAGGARKVER